MFGNDTKGDMDRQVRCSASQLSILKRKSKKEGNKSDTARRVCGRTGAIWVFETIFASVSLLGMRSTGASPRCRCRLIE